MSNYNRVILAGRLARDPQTRQAGNSQVAGFGLAINRTWKDRDGAKQEETTFVDVECWGRTAELVSQYLSKGRGCLVEGRLRLDQWEDKDGGKRSKLKVVAEAVQFLGGGDRQAAPAATDPGGGRVHEPAPGIDEEPPF